MAHFAFIIRFERYAVGTWGSMNGWQNLSFAKKDHEDKSLDPSYADGWVASLSGTGCRRQTAAATLLSSVVTSRAPFLCVTRCDTKYFERARCAQYLVLCCDTKILYTQDHATIRNSLDYEYCRCKDSDAVRFWIRRPGASTLLPLTWQDINDLAIQKHGSSNWDHRNICRGESSLPLHWLKKYWPKICSKSLKFGKKSLQLYLR